MTLSQLIKQFRILAFDEIEPYLFSDDKIIHWLNDAVKEACIRGRLLYYFDDMDVCQVPLQQGKSKYKMHQALYELTHACIDVNGIKQPLCLLSFEEMDEYSKQWRYDNDDKLPSHLIQFDDCIRLSKPIPMAGVLLLEGYGIAKTPMSDGNDTPAIGAVHHEYLLDWVLHKAFGIPDSEVFDANKSLMAEQRFSQYFGIRPDSDIKRITRHDVPHTVKAFWV